VIESTTKDGVAVLAMRHGKANALDIELCQELCGALDDAAAGDAAAVVLTGAGTVFSAGVDLKRVTAGREGYVTAFLPELRRAFTRLVLPELGSYIARLAIVAVFLGAYGIPVSFHNVATVTASNSISNSVSATPGGVGVTQAMNSAALSGEASAKTATAYSIGQQLIISAWDVLFAIVLVSWAFGWSGGKQLVESSYTEAKVKSSEMRESRKKKKEGS